MTRVLAGILCLVVSVASVILRTILSLDSQTFATFLQVMASFLWNSAQTTGIILVFVSGLAFYRWYRLQGSLAEAIWTAVLIGLAIKVAVNLLLPFCT